MKTIDVMAGMRAYLLTTIHTCNAYCRGDRHAQVCWIEACPAYARQEARLYFAHFGLTVLAIDDAPEAMMPTAITVYTRQSGFVDEVAPLDTAQATALLVTFTAPR